VEITMETDDLII